MPFFGILWVASWINCSFSYGFQGSIISDYLSLAFKNKPLANISNPLVKLTNQSSAFAPVTVAAAAKPTVSNSTFVPPANLSTIASVSSSLIPSSSPSSSLSQTVALDSGSKFSPEGQFASEWLKTGEDNFCQAETTALDYSWTNLPTTDGESKSLLDAPSQGTSKVSLSSKIVQVLHSLLRWQDYFVNQPKISPPSVIVVRSDTLMPQQARRNFWLLSQKPQENTLSDAQQSSGSSFAVATPKFQVWLKRYLISEFDQKLDADLLAQRLQQLVNNPNLDAQKLQPGLVNGEPAIKLGDRLLFLVSDALKENIHTNKDLIAIKLTNSLRLALGAPALDLAQAQIKMYGLSETSHKISGLASWYGSYFHGRQTANGEIYDQYALTVAHPSLPFDTYLKIINQKNNKSVVVRVNDRGPYIPPRVLDLSKIAARCIDSEDHGVVMVDAVIMQSIEESKLERK